MKRGLGLLITMTFGFAAVFLTTWASAGTQVNDVIKMENKAYEKHKKSLVTFSHKKHNEEYQIGCGRCHHDEQNKPLEGLKMGDDVKNCIECHKKPGRKPKAKKDEPPIADKERLEYHAEAIHLNCAGCHKNANKKSGNKNAPTACADCHPGK